MRARWGDFADNSHSDFRFEPQITHNYINEKEAMNQNFDKMSAG